MAASVRESGSAGLEELSQSLRRTPMPDQIAGYIRRMILSSELSPGNRIVESRIARQLGVGQPTVREALVALEHQGLVMRKANQGCVVTQLSRDEIAHALRVRAELEALAVDLAIENAADGQIAELVELARRMEKIAKAGGLDDFFEIDLQFHETLWRLSGGNLLPRLLSQVLVPLLAFLFLRNVRNRSLVDLKESASVHTGIARAVAARDRKQARRIVKEKLEVLAGQHLRWFEEGEGV